MTVLRKTECIARLALVAVVVIATAFGGMLPALTRLLGGPPVHVCHCEVRGGHATCACPRCNAELRDDEDADAYGTLRTTCGDDDEATFGKALVMTHAPRVQALVRISELTRRVFFLPSDPSRGPRPPDSPPPKLSHA